MTEPEDQVTTVKNTDDDTVWHLTAEVLAAGEVRTVCGRVVSRGRAVVGDGRMCAQCETASS